MKLAAFKSSTLLVLSLMLMLGTPALAVDYPTRPIHFVVSFAAGGPNDTIARLLGQYLSEQLGQPLVIEDRAGAGGNVGMQYVLSAPPDGYTIGFVAPNNAINATLYEHIPFDFVHDSTPIAGTMKLANVLDANLNFPAKNIADLIAMAKANPGKINFGSGGVGTSPHMSGELLEAMTGIKLTHVAYRGTALGMTDLLGGQIPLMFDNLPGSIQQIQAGKIRALGVTTAKRVDAVPNVPTIAETVPGYEVFVWYGISAPKGVPPEIVDKLNTAVNAVLADPKLKERFHELGGEVMPMSPAEFGKLVADETVKWAKVVKFAGVKVQ
ncbi:MAG: tripartite tricarboxylate transporter substrate binding protein [Xanthobacteraceae bacterium]